MPHLDWKDAKVGLQVSSHPRFQTQLSLEMEPEDLRFFRDRVEEVSSGPDSELRIYLPQGWILFWKKRETGSRLLLAHPEPDEWVGTVALEDADLKKVVASMDRLLDNLEGSPSPAKSVVIGQQANLAGMSNLEVEMRVKKK